MSGQHGGALVKSHSPSVLFIHCYAHKLNLVFAQTTFKQPNWFLPVLMPFTLFSHVHVRDQHYCVKLIELCAYWGRSVVRWNFKSCRVDAIDEGRRPLCIAFDKIMREPGWDKQSIA